MKNQSRGHAKKVKCSSTSKRVRAHSLEAAVVTADRSNEFEKEKLYEDLKEAC